MLLEQESLTARTLVLKIQWPGSFVSNPSSERRPREKSREHRSSGLVFDDLRALVSDLGTRLARLYCRAPRRQVRRG